MKRILEILLVPLIFSSAQNLDTVIVDINKIKLPMINNGTIGEVYPFVVYDSTDIIYSAGFFLSGKANDTVWSNGMFASERIFQYRPGKFSDTMYNTNYKFYELRSSDEPFGQSWQEWKSAVKLGAKFYDGDGDGIYNPVDKNGNGKWDEEEDRPDLIGDYTNWTLYNDNVPTEERHHKVGQPLGIEIKQTAFAYYREGNEVLNNTIFFRYILENVSENPRYDSVYFGCVSDPDIGKYDSDFTGCDTNLNSVFAYKKKADFYYGENPPSVFFALLQGPVIQSDSTKIGVIRNGPYLGETIIQGAQNLKMSSSYSFYRYWLDYSNFHQSIRNTLVGGKDRDGSPLIVREFEFGNGDSLGAAADTISPYFMFSGDPVTGTGWLNIFGTDWRMVASYGPFTLERNKPQEIIVSLTIGRGDTPLNSVAVARKLVKSVIQFYESNFTQIPVSIKNENIKIPEEFVLYQNYPNPFNPTTTIKYQLPTLETLHATSVQLVQLKVYDVLGREVATLVNKKQSPGNYTVTFNAKNLPSGIYFYQLSAGNFVQTRKMILMK